MSICGKMAALAAIMLVSAACGGGNVDGSSGFGGDDDDDALGDGDGDGDGDADPVEGGEEQCGDGVDNDGDGNTDEGCDCVPDTTRECWPAAPELAGVGACTAGTQTCDSSFEFGEWGACEGAVLPAAEVCGDAVDNDCDGVLDNGCSCAVGETRACFDGAAELIGVGVCREGTQTCAAGGDENAWGDCAGAVMPGAEVCGDGIDQDCDGTDSECESIVLQLDIDGDCVTASCPPEAPFPIACDIDFQGGDERGCVAYVLGSSVVYFQEGNVCNAGHLTGTLTCSTEPGGGLNAQNCPINKDVPFYETDPDDCPD